ncbi:MAG: hypothetical protein ACTSXD_04770, partial [Candidatus Heimdallarchaeaceae archaeon]
MIEKLYYQNVKASIKGQAQILLAIIFLLAIPTTIIVAQNMTETVDQFSLNENSETISETTTTATTTTTTTLPETTTTILEETTT